MAGITTRWGNRQPQVPAGLGQEEQRLSAAGPGEEAGIAASGWHNGYGIITPTIGSPMICAGAMR